MDINYQIIDSILASIYWKDLKGIYLGCNKYMLQMSGFEDRSQIIGKSDYEMPWKEQAAEIVRTDELVVINNKTYKLEERPVIHGNVSKTFLSSKAPLVDDDGTIIGIIGVSIDITDKKDIEHILELTEQHLEKTLNIKERFLKNLNHETRNPLAAMIGNIELLTDRWNNFDDVKKYEFVVKVANSARRLSSFLNNNFDLSNFINDKTKLDLKRSCINDLIELSIKTFEGSSSIHRIEFKYKRKHFLVFDWEKMKQVIGNLLSNALKWTEQDGIISIEVWKNFSSDSSIPGLHCRITNKGIGIPQDELKFIFEPFTESSNTASKACGTGLGLALCREIIKAHKGEIWANSSESATSAEVSFHFVIPATLMENDL
jgi:signal transduction histidine kinase